MNTKEQLLKHIVEFLNSVSSVQINLDELSTIKDSICVAETEGTQETADVTSIRFVDGTLTLNIIYRKIGIDDGNDDIIYTSILNNLSSSLLRGFKQIKGTGYCVETINVDQPATLDAVYADSNTKDFKTVVKMQYQRQIY